MPASERAPERRERPNIGEERSILRWGPVNAVCVLVSVANSPHGL